jgi:uncharacterized protein involved in outer membrane biogenesis
MNRFLLSLGASVVCVLAALFAVPQFIDWNYFRGVFEDEASRLVGREVKVRGEVNLRLLPTPFIRFDKISIADPRMPAAEPLFKADGFIVWLSISPLFKGTLEASRVELTRPVLTLVADDAGGGNWNSLTDSRSRSVFAPSSVTLQTVHITDGAVVLQDPQGKRLEFGVGNAEFSAAALDGPYRLQATVESPEGTRELRLSTAKAESDGSVRFKSVLRTLDGSESYALDGQLFDLTGRTRASGDLVATLPVLGNGAKTSAEADKAGTHGTAAAAGRRSNPFDVRAAFKADPRGVELSNLALSFDSDGRPQLASGEAKFAWGQTQSANIRLESRWLDLDRIAGSDEATSPLRLVERIAGTIDRLMPANGRTQATFDLDQAGLGGEAVSGLHVVLEKDQRTLKLGQLRAGLPGGARVDVNGTLSPDQADRAFDGDVVLRGASVNRLLAWVSKGQDLPELKQDGSFTVRGKVSMGQGHIAGRDLTMQLAGNIVSGDVSWSTREHRRLAVSLEGSELDITPLLGKDVKAQSLLDLLPPGFKAFGVTSGRAATDAQSVEATIRVRTGRLMAGATTLRNVVADISIDRDALKVPQLKGASDDGLAFDVSGTITGLASGLPKGSFGGTVMAPSGDSIGHLVDALGLPEALQPSLRRAQALSPLKLAGTIAVGGRTVPAADVIVDGMLGSSRFSGKVALDDVRLPWREQRLDAAVSLDGAEVSTLLGQVLPDAVVSGSAKEVRTPALATLHAAGTPARGLVSLININAAGLNGEFRGRVAVDDVANLVIDGETRFAADDLGRALALVDTARRRGLDGVPIEARLGTSLDRGKLKIEATRLALGAARIAGTLGIDANAARPRASGRLYVSEISVPRLLSVLADGRLDAPQEAKAESNEGHVWPDVALNMAPLSSFDADLKIDTPSLALMRDMSVSEAALETNVADGRLTIRMLDARALGGKAAANLALVRTAAGVTLEGEAHLTDTDLAQGGMPERPAASGEMSANVQFTSVGFSPRGLVGALRGKGALIFGEARLNRMSPGAINAAALAALTAPGDGLAAELKRKLEAGLGMGALALGPRSVPFEIADGALRIQPIAIDGPDGRVTGNTTVDLSSLKFDSDWRIEPKAQGQRAAQGKALPGVSMLYVGELPQLAAVEPRLQYDALERELSVRKIERYVEELERLRRSDEERVHQERLRQEAERQRVIEMERQRQEDERQRSLQRGAIEVPARQTSGSASVTAGSAQSGGATARPAQSEAGSAPPPRPRQSSPLDVLRQMGDRSQ